MTKMGYSTYAKISFKNCKIRFAPIVEAASDSKKIDENSTLKATHRRTGLIKFRKGLFRMPISLATNMTVKVLNNSRKGMPSNTFGELVRREQGMGGAKQQFVYRHGPAFELH